MKAVSADDKRIFTGEDNIFQLFPLRYKWAWDSYLAMMDNHWTPREIPVAKDVELYRSKYSMDDPIKHLFDGVMAQLTTFDIQRGMDIAENLMYKVKAPEIKQALLQQAAQEALHTWSYQYCIENLGMDEGIIYNMYRTIPQMRSRVEYARWMGEKVDFGVIEPLIEDEPVGYGLEDVIEGIAFWYLGFEGVWFVASLSGPIQGLARHGLFKATAEQFQYILRDETLHVNFGVDLLLSIKQEHPKHWEESKDKIYSMIEDVVKLEDGYIDYLIPSPMLHYNAVDHKAYTRYLADRRLQSIGLDPIFGVKDNPMFWIDQMTGALKKEKNFFETRVTEYRGGGALNWDDDSKDDDWVI